MIRNGAQDRRVFYSLLIVLPLLGLSGLSAYRYYSTPSVIGTWTSEADVRLLVFEPGIVSACGFRDQPGKSKKRAGYFLQMKYHWSSKNQLSFQYSIPNLGKGPVIVKVRGDSLYLDNGKGRSYTLQRTPAAKEPFFSADPEGAQ